VDESVGVIAQAMHDSGMYNNSIMIYSSDNGGPANMSNNMPLRGAKFSVFEGA
jgi:arylsulfatase A-like enzyme